MAKVAGSYDAAETDSQDDEEEATQTVPSRDTIPGRDGNYCRGWETQFVSEWGGPDGDIPSAQPFELNIFNS